MITNPIWANYEANQEERNLLDGLVMESIQIQGQDVYFLPIKRTAFDQIFYEDAQPVFDRNFLIEMHLRAPQGFTGDQSIMAQFGQGLQIWNQYTFTVSRTRWEQEVTQKDTEILRPREQDLIYFPMNKNLFQIKYVAGHEPFYQHGQLYVWTITAELIAYSNEKLVTGIPEIDDIQKRMSNNLLDYAIKTEAGEYMKTDDGDYIIQDKYQTNQEKYDPGVDNKTLVDEASQNVDFDPQNPFLEKKPY